MTKEEFENRFVGRTITAFQIDDLDSHDELCWGNNPQVTLDDGSVWVFCGEDFMASITELEPIKQEIVKRKKEQS